MCADLVEPRRSGDVLHIPSPSGADLVAHEHTSAGPTLLVAHATGLHGRCYRPLIDAFAGSFRVVTVDLRGHGDSDVPAGWDGDWSGLVDDVVAAAVALGPPLLAFGHSMGGNNMLVAARREPSLFSGLVVYEPSLFPSDGPEVPANALRPELITRTQRRRSSFGSRDEASEYFRVRAPFSTFTPEALAAFVQHGLSSDDEGAFELRCRPAVEAMIYARFRADDLWSSLERITTPTLVVSGTPEPMETSTYARQGAERLADAAYVQLDGLTHFGPMTDPARVARVVEGFLDTTHVTA